MGDTNRVQTLKFKVINTDTVSQTSVIAFHITGTVDESLHVLSAYEIDKELASVQNDTKFQNSRSKVRRNITAPTWKSDFRNDYGSPNLQGSTRRINFVEFCSCILSVVLSKKK